MSTQQDIYAAGSESHPPMLNKENYVPWSSRLLWYAKSRPNGKLIHNSIINGPYVTRMIPEPGDTNRKVLVNETFHVQTDDELTEKELKQIEADDQAIQTIFLGLPKDIYAAVDSCETTQEIWLRVQKMMKGSDIGIQKKKAKLFNKWERKDCQQSQVSKQLAARMVSTCYYRSSDKRLAKTQDPLALMANSNNPYAIPAPHQDQPSFNQNYMQPPVPNPEDITDPITTMNMALALMAKAFKLNYSTPTNNNQRISSNLRNRQIAQPGNLNGYNAIQNVRNQVAQHAVQNPRIQNGVPGNANQNLNGNGNLVAARAEGNATGQNGNHIRAAAADLNEIEEVNANCILMANLQQASTSSTQTDKAPVYDSDRSAEVHNYENCDDNEIFNMFTQKEQYTELLEPIPEPYQVPQNDNNVISEVSSVEHSEGTVEQHPANVEKTRALYDSLYQNLAIEVEKVNTIHMLSPKPDSFYHTEQKMALGYQNPFYLKQAQKKQQSLYDGKVLVEKHDPPIVHDSKETLQLAQENDTTPSVSRKFLNMVKSTIVTLQHVVKHRMTLETHNWSSSAHQELHKIVKDENFPIVNQVDARVQNFEIQFLKEAAKFVGYFKSVAKETDESLANAYRDFMTNTLLDTASESPLGDHPTQYEHRVSFLALQIRSVRIQLSKVELLLVAFDTQLKVFHTSQNDDASCEHSKRDIKRKTFFDSQISQLALYKKQQHIFDVLDA
nr:hypothetical protein [Tanacetum cinerariifolium]